MLKYTLYIPSSKTHLVPYQNLDVPNTSVQILLKDDHTIQRPFTWQEFNFAIKVGLNSVLWYRIWINPSPCFLYAREFKLIFHANRHILRGKDFTYSKGVIRGHNPCSMGAESMQMTSVVYIRLHKVESLEQWPLTNSLWSLRNTKRCILLPLSLGVIIIPLWKLRCLQFSSDVCISKRWRFKWNSESIV